MRSGDLCARSCDHSLGHVIPELGHVILVVGHDLVRWFI